MMSSNVLLSQVDKTTIISFPFGGIQINQKTLLNENHRPSKKFSNLIPGMGGREVSLFELKWKEKKVGKKKNGQKWMLTEHTHGQSEWEWEAHRETENRAEIERASERAWKRGKGIPRINYERIQFRFLGTLKRLWIRNEIRTVYFMRVKMFPKSFCSLWCFFFLFRCMCALFPIFHHDSFV